MHTEGEKSPTENVEQHEGFNPRAIEVYMVRHGKQTEYEDAYSSLSPEGEQQARDFAHSLARDIGNANTVVKIKFSGEKRTTKTAHLIKEELEKLIGENALPRTKLLADHPTKQLKTTGGIKSVLEAGIPYEQAMEEWLKNTDQYPTTRRPEEIKDEIDYLVDVTSKTAERVPIEGPGIVYVWVTHETSSAAVMKSLTNKTPDELGGPIGHLEPLKISFDKADPSHPHVSFRGHELTYEHNATKE